jgi:hypothetical protein
VLLSAASWAASASGYMFEWFLGSTTNEEGTTTPPQLPADTMDNMSSPGRPTHERRSSLPELSALDMEPANMGQVIEYIKGKRTLLWLGCIHPSLRHASCRIPFFRTSPVAISLNVYPDRGSWGLGHFGYHWPALHSNLL